MFIIPLIALAFASTTTEPVDSVPVESVPVETVETTTVVTEPTPTFVSEPVWVVSDDPCPAGTSATVPAGSSYEAGIWEDPQGNLLGFASTEDSCVVSMTDDLADAPIPTDLEHGVREVRVIDGYPHIVTFDVDAPTYDYPPNGTNPPDPADPPQGGLPATR